MQRKLIKSLAKGNDKDTINSEIKTDYNKVIQEINENSNIQIITKNKNEDDVLNLLSELIEDHKNLDNLLSI